MKFNTTLSILIVALILSTSGLIISVVIPHNTTSDNLMIASLFSVAASGIMASVFTKRLAKSKQWNYVLIGGLLLLLSFPAKVMGYHFGNNMLKVSGMSIGIIALGYYIYLHRANFQNSKWIWLMPLILLGCLFKYMHWPGGNIIIFGSLFALAVAAIIQLVKYKAYTKVQLLFLLWQLVMCVCIVVFYFRWVTLDPFIIGYIFAWLARVDILLHQEKNGPEVNAFISNGPGRR